MSTLSFNKPALQPPPSHDWRTTDEDEIARRRLRARTEPFQIRNCDPAHPIFSNFNVKSGSGLTYSVEVRDLRQRQFACDCVDFRINGLGTCKHVEAVLLHLEARFKRLFRQAAANGAGPPGRFARPRARHPPPDERTRPDARALAPMVRRGWLAQRWSARSGGGGIATPGRDRAARFARLAGTGPVAGSRAAARTNASACGANTN